MNVISWPDLFTSGNTKIKKEKEMATQCLKLLLKTERGTLEFDPGYGIALAKFIYDQNSSYLVSLIVEQIYEGVKKYIPQIRVNREDIVLTRNKNVVTINIVYSYVIDSTSDMLSIDLVEE